MPNVSTTLVNVAQTVTRPSIFDIINQVLHITGIDPTTKIFWPGDVQKMQVAGTDNASSDDKTAIFNSARYTYISVEEDYDINTVGTTAITRAEHIPVFTDNALGVVLTPVYATNNISIHFKYTSNSKTEVTTWRDDVRMRVSQMRDVNLHSITYHYTLPEAFVEVLLDIHRKREAKAPYGQTFEEYVVSNATDRLTLVGDSVGNSAILAVSETQTRIIGMFDFDAIPEKAERDDNGTWSISFSYRFNFEEPIACNARYPIMVHNQLLEPEYTDFTNKHYDLDKVNKVYSASIHAMSGFESDTLMNSVMDNNTIIRIPEFDDFSIDQLQKSTGTIFIALSEIDDDKRTLLNLNELGDIALDPDILAFIKESELSYVTKFYESIFSLSLYRDKYLASSGSLVCDSSLNVKAITDLDLRRLHRVRLSIVTDLTLLPASAFARLKKYPKVLVKVIGVLNAVISNHPDLADFANRPQVTDIEFSLLYQLLTGVSLGKAIGDGTGSRGVGGIYGNNWRNGGIQPYSKGLRPIVGTDRPSGDGVRSLGVKPFMLFADIDPALLENYRRNKTNTNTVMLSGIIASRNN